MITTKSELEELFLRKKPIKMLMCLKMGGAAKYVSALSKETDCTYSHTVKLLEDFRKLGLVEFEKLGRVKHIKLTPDGAELATHFEFILRKFSKLKPKKPFKPEPEAKPKLKAQIPPPPRPPLPPTATTDEF